MLTWGPATDVDRALLTDPQTSGGLLVAVPSPRVRDYLERVPRAVEIGEVLPEGATAIVLG
jgi:selenophosphate synthase